LKPVVGSPLTEVSERPTASAHLDSGLAGKEGACRCSYLVRMIKPNSITSHDWHVQPICQRSLPATRLSGAVLDRGPGLRRGVLELVAHSDLCFESSYRCFCANLLNLSDFHLSVKLNSYPRTQLRKVPLKTCPWRSLRRTNPDFPERRKLLVRRVRTAQNIKERPDKNSRAARARRRSTPGSCNGLFSLGIPYSGSRGTCLT
jgi:hypothetical protein